MSWDVSMAIDTGGEYPATVCEVRNLTWNNSKILVALKCHPDDMSGKTGAEIAPIARKALADSWTREASLKKMEPENKWGGVNDVRDYLAKLVEACEKNPKAVLVVH